MQNEDQGFQKIGDLMSKVSRSLEQKDTANSKSDGFGNVSVTTGEASPARKDANSTGTEHGAIMSVERLPESKLAALSPVQVDKEIKAQFPSSVNLSLSRAEKLDSEYNIVGYGPIECDRSDLNDALEVINAYSEPLSYAKTAEKLYRAYIITKHRSDEVQDQKMIIAAYADAFDEWPADVASDVLDLMPTMAGGWWPSYADVIKALEHNGGERKKMKRAIEDAIYRG